LEREGQKNRAEELRAQVAEGQLNLETYERDVFGWTQKHLRFKHILNARAYVVLAGLMAVLAIYQFFLK
jgi:hypothetical protein